MELAIPSSLISNIETVVRYQNIQLIKEICRWKNWDCKELISVLLPQTEKEKKIKRVGLKKSTLVINNEEIHSEDKKIDTNKKEIEIRVRTQWMFNHITYYVESPHNNVYRDTRYVGRKVDDRIDSDFPEL